MAAIDLKNVLRVLRAYLSERNLTFAELTSAHIDDLFSLGITKSQVEALIADGSLIADDSITEAKLADDVKTKLNKSGGSSTFTELTDTPAAIGTGNAGKILQGNAAGDGLEFTDKPDLTAYSTTAQITTAISDAIGNIPDANDSVKGKVELATNNETTTGTDTTRAVTPAGVKSALSGIVSKNTSQDTEIANLKNADTTEATTRAEADTALGLRIDEIGGDSNHFVRVVRKENADYYARGNKDYYVENTAEIVKQDKYYIVNPVVADLGTIPDDEAGKYAIKDSSGTITYTAPSKGDIAIMFSDTQVSIPDKFENLQYLNENKIEAILIYEGQWIITNSHFKNAINCTETGIFANVEGVENNAIGDHSHVEGDNNTASYEAGVSHAEGSFNTIKVPYAHIQGYRGVLAEENTIHAIAYGDHSPTDAEKTGSVNVGLIYELDKTGNSKQTGTVTATDFVKTDGTSIGGTVPDASTTVKGKVELANNTETTTGTDTTRAVTPAGVKSALSGIVSKNTAQDTKITALENADTTIRSEFAAGDTALGARIDAYDALPMAGITKTEQLTFFHDPHRINAEAAEPMHTIISTLEGSDATAKELYTTRQAGSFVSADNFMPLTTEEFDVSGERHKALVATVPGDFNDYTFLVVQFNDSSEELAKTVYIPLDTISNGFDWVISDARRTEDINKRELRVRVELDGNNTKIKFHQEAVPTSSNSAIYLFISFFLKLKARGERGLPGPSQDLSGYYTKIETDAKIAEEDQKVKDASRFLLASWRGDDGSPFTTNGGSLPVAYKVAGATYDATNDWIDIGTGTQGVGWLNNEIDFNRFEMVSRFRVGQGWNEMFYWGVRDEFALNPDGTFGWTHSTTNSGFAVLISPGSSGRIRLMAFNRELTSNTIVAQEDTSDFTSNGTHEIRIAVINGEIKVSDNEGNVQATFTIPSTLHANALGVAGGRFGMIHDGDPNDRDVKLQDIYIKQPDINTFDDTLTLPAVSDASGSGNTLTLKRRGGDDLNLKIVEKSERVFANSSIKKTGSAIGAWEFKVANTMLLEVGKSEETPSGVADSNNQYKGISIEIPKDKWNDMNKIVISATHSSQVFMCNLPAIYKSDLTPGTRVRSGTSGVGELKLELYFEENKNKSGAVDLTSNRLVIEVINQAKVTVYIGEVFLQHLEIS